MTRASLALLSLLPALAGATATYQYIQPANPASGPDLCAGVGDVYDGGLVDTYNCTTDTYATYDWLIKKGANTVVKLAGTGLCLDTDRPTDKPTDSLAVLVCEPGKASQRWTYRSDNRIALDKGETCLVCPDNDISYGSYLVTEPCSNAKNQTWGLKNIQATFTTTTHYPNPTVPSKTECRQGVQEILYPTAGTNITKKYPTGSFSFRYCSGEYYTSTTSNITVYLAPATSTNPIKDGVVLASKRSDGSVDGDYILTLTKPEGAAHNSTLFVAETYYGADDANLPYQKRNTTLATNVKF